MDIEAFRERSDTTQIGMYCDQLTKMRSALDAVDRWVVNVARAPPVFSCTHRACRVACSTVSGIHIEEEILGWSVTDFTCVVENRRALAPFLTLWLTYKELDVKYTRWTKGACTAAWGACAARCTGGANVVDFVRVDAVQALCSPSTLTSCPTTSTACGARS
jgi:hypothetical protein